MLTCHNFSDTYKNATPLRGLGFSLLPGCLLLLEGSQNSYKETILHYLAYKNDTATYISAESALPRWLRVADYLQKHASSELLIPAALHYFGLTDYADVRCRKLPPALQQRLRLGFLLLTPSKIWLLDNPTRHLDEEGKKLLYKLIADRCNQGGIVIINGLAKDAISSAIVLNMDDFT